MSKPKKSIIYKQVKKTIKPTFIQLITKQFSIIFIFFLSLHISVYAQSGASTNKFKVVLDAGHGGTDSGTLGNGLQEKDVAFDVTNRIYELLKKESDLEVVRTRTTDFKVPLSRRAEIANKEDANVFVSIHCNGVANPNPKGFETFVFGVRRNKDNLETAKRENSVIYLEDDHEKRYGNFDPNSPESFISFTLMQEEYLDQSILLANYIQTSVLKSVKMVDRGVKQDVFLVLRETFMPSVLVELGFLTNKDDATMLKSDANKQKMAQEIAKAIIEYKNALPSEDTSSSQYVETETTQKIASVSFSVQLVATSREIDPDPKDFKGLEPLAKLVENGMNKIVYGYSENYMEAQELLQDALEKGYDSAFIVAFDQEGNKITVNEALKSKLK